MFSKELNIFIKLGEAQVISPSDVHTAESVLADPIIENRFKKLAGSLKRIAPKANEFLYFSAVMMHAAEASLVNSDGTPKLASNGDIVKAAWEEKGESLKWVCSDSNIRPYKNSNGDIFPEKELLKAYKNWVGKPLCVDHKSNSVDAIRGIILDTYYDRTFKRVIALCALDKITYPDLAKKVSLGYSTCVSMGTAVGKAICSDCGTVARTENEFCNHMRTKSCYGEINTDLHPIELSIVVTGADPQAKIRTIIAAANTINNHLAEQEAELMKISNSTNLETDQLNKLQSLEDDLRNANEKLAELKSIIESSPEAPYGQTGNYSSESDEVNQQEVSLNLPERLASVSDSLINEVKNLRASLEQKLFSIENSLDKLNKNKEEIMSKDAMNKQAYFQGGGGVNEPTPGQKKYPVDPKNEEMRSKDKHMVGQTPFPEVGSVDGMHPSPESSDQKDELERKKMLARAERRAAALQKAKENIEMSKKEAYWQGGGGVNEPTPGKPKYPVDNLEYELREKEDKHMTGQKPFPGVGDVDGLHPSPASAEQKDELERKKMLQRASLKARFVRAANTDGTDNLGASAWQVFSKDDNGEKLVFTASVDEISGGRSDVLFDVIATKDFGSKMLEKIRSVGLVKAASVYKKAQAVTGPAATPGVAADVGGAGPAPAMPDLGAPAATEEPAADEGGKGDPKEAALDLAEKVRDLSSDLLEAVRSLTGEQSQMGEMEDSLATMPKAASANLKPLYKMRRELNAALLSGAKKSLAELREHAEELELIASVVDSNTSVNKEYVDTIVEDALEDAKKAVADAYGIMRGFSKYSRGTAGLLKRAEEVSVLVATAETSSSDDDSSSSSDDDTSSADDSYTSDEDMANDENFDMDTDFDFEDESDHEHDEEGHDFEEPSLEDVVDELPEEEMSADDMNDTTVELPEGAPVPPGAKAVEEKTASFDLTTKAGRAAYRAKLAADATGKQDDGEAADEASLVGSDSLDDADKLADGQTKLDVKPSDELGRVETVEEQHKKDMEVAKAEPKVRKEAERLNQLISEGKVAASELDSLIAQGLDPEVVKYWKQFYGQAGKEGSEFAKLLTTETLKAKAEEEVKNYKVKIARAYELAHEMVRRGLLADDRAAITAQVEDIMKWNDEGFESMKRVVAKYSSPMKKQASIPQVGLIGSSDNQPVRELDFQAELDRAFANRKY